MHIIPYSKNVFTTCTGQICISTEAEVRLSSSKSKTFRDLGVSYEYYGLISSSRLKDTNLNNYISIINTDNTPFNRNKLSSLLTDIYHEKN